jgi:hypothetical protein
LGAEHVAFLIADMSGRAVVRLTPDVAAPATAVNRVGSETTRSRCGEQAQTVPFSDEMAALVLEGLQEPLEDSTGLATALHEIRGLRPREATRRLADTALHLTGHALRDDATVLLLDWYAAHNTPRDSTGGAALSRL